MREKYIIIRVKRRFTLSIKNTWAIRLPGKSICIMHWRYKFNMVRPLPVLSNRWKAVRTTCFLSRGIPPWVINNYNVFSPRKVRPLIKKASLLKILLNVTFEKRKKIFVSTWRYRTSSKTMNCERIEKKIWVRHKKQGAVSIKIYKEK